MHTEEFSPFSPDKLRVFRIDFGYREEFLPSLGVDSGGVIHAGFIGEAGVTLKAVSE